MIIASEVADATVQTKLEGVKKKIADQEAKAGVEAKFQNLKIEHYLILKYRFGKV